MDPALATRSEIREYVRVNGVELLSVAQSGGNVYQKSLDQQDELDELIGHLDDDAKLRFLNIYTEELNARTAQLDQDTNVILESAVKAEKSSQEIGGIIAGVIFLALALFIIIKLSS
ncbi:hypothetical protein [Pseudomonas brenneri]|uniref:hypothetical protein n=1 Tax=Pseudomonas brenneri TaxID=129817 RepID=UPI0028D23C40|nr:hypothetical protein [Pseudomonas brenneri]